MWSIKNANLFSCGKTISDTNGTGRREMSLSCIMVYTSSSGDAGIFIRTGLYDSNGKIVSETRFNCFRNGNDRAYWLTIVGYCIESGK